MPQKMSNAMEYDGFEWADFSPKFTKLPCTIWIKANERAEDICPYLEIADGENRIAISIHTTPILFSHQVKLTLSPAQYQDIQNWIVRNYTCLLDYWNCKLTTDELMDLIQ